MHRIARALVSAVGLAGVVMATPGVRAEPSVEVIALNYIDARRAAEIVNALYAEEVRAMAFEPTNALLVDLTPSAAPSSAAVAPGTTDPRRYPAGPSGPFSPFNAPSFGPRPYARPIGPGWNPNPAAGPTNGTPTYPVPNYPAPSSVPYPANAPAPSAPPKINPEAPLTP